jgi:hypothetical protein
VVDDGVKKLVPTSSAAADGDKIYDLICRRFLMMWHDDYLQAVGRVCGTKKGIGNNELIESWISDSPGQRHCYDKLSHCLILISISSETADCSASASNT